MNASYGLNLKSLNDQALIKLAFDVKAERDNRKRRVKHPVNTAKK